MSVYHVLIKNKVVGESTTCSISAPGGCGVKWINEFSYMTIPTLALTAFALLFGLLLIASFGPRATLRA